jgi:hypothetical protein
VIQRMVRQVLKHLAKGFRAVEDVALNQLVDLLEVCFFLARVD